MLSFSPQSCVASRNKSIGGADRERHDWPVRSESGGYGFQARERNRVDFGCVVGESAERNDDDRERSRDLLRFRADQPVSADVFYLILLMSSIWNQAFLFTQNFRCLRSTVYEFPLTG